MAYISVGQTASDYVGNERNCTFLSVSYPCNGYGYITDLQIYEGWSTNTYYNTHVGSAYRTNEYFNSQTWCYEYVYTPRSYANLGDITLYWGVNYFTGLAIYIEQNDYLASYIENPDYYVTFGYAGVSHITSINSYSNIFNQSSVVTSDCETLNGLTLSIYGYGDGVTLPSIASLAATNVTHNSATVSAQVYETGDNFMYQVGINLYRLPNFNYIRYYYNYDNFNFLPATVYSYNTQNYGDTLVSSTQHAYESEAYNSLGVSYGGWVYFTTLAGGKKINNVLMSKYNGITIVKFNNT